MATVTDHLQMQVLQMDSKFQKACGQVLVFNNFLRQLQIRYDRAARDNLRHTDMLSDFDYAQLKG